jgi:hypothetical protein
MAVQPFPDWSPDLLTTPFPLTSNRLTTFWQFYCFWQCAVRRLCHPLPRPPSFWRCWWTFRETAPLQSASGQVSSRKKSPFAISNRQVPMFLQSHTLNEAVHHLKPIPLITILQMVLMGPGSSVSIATGYGLDGPGIESRWGRNFPHLSRPALGATQPPVQWAPGLSRG